MLACFVQLCNNGESAVCMVSHDTYKYLYETITAFILDCIPNKVKVIDSLSFIVAIQFDLTKCLGKVHCCITNALFAVNIRKCVVLTL